MRLQQACLHAPDRPALDKPRSVASLSPPRRCARHVHVVQPPVRIYLVGSHSTGKTTLARWIRDRYGLPMIAEVARGVLAELESPLDQIRSNLEVVDRYQMRVFERQIAAEREQPSSFVSDRAFCNLAYAAHHSTVLARLCAQTSFTEYMDSVREGIVFFLRPHPSLLKEDGVRAGVSWESVLRIDGMIKLMLEMHRIPYLPVESVSMQERVRSVDFVMQRAGLAQILSERRLATTPNGPQHAAANGKKNGKPATTTTTETTREQELLKARIGN